VAGQAATGLPGCRRTRISAWKQDCRPDPTSDHARRRKRCVEVLRPHVQQSFRQYFASTLCVAGQCLKPASWAGSDFLRKIALSDSIGGCHLWRSSVRSTPRPENVFSTAPRTLTRIPVFRPVVAERVMRCQNHEIFIECSSVVTRINIASEEGGNVVRWYRRYQSTGFLRLGGFATLRVSTPWKHSVDQVIHAK